MADKLFFCDPFTNSSYSYHDLHCDCVAVNGLLNILTTTDCYELMVNIVAAVGSDSRVTIASRDGINATTQSELAPRFKESETPSPNSLSLGELRFPDTILLSQARIGMFTSGTTGKPDWVEHNLQTLMRSVRLGENHADDVWGLAYHPSRIAGLQVFLQAVCNQNPLIKLFELPPQRIHSAIEDYGVTHLSATPTFYRLLCADSVVHEQVARITVGGEILSEKLIGQLRQSFPNAKVLNVYATTETGSLFAAKDGCFSIPKNLESLVRIEDGELQVHRSLLAESMQIQAGEEFYATGDCVTVIGQSPLRLRITSRRSEFINVGGFKVNPHDVEYVLQGMAEVSAARVYGRSNSVTGSLVCCDVVPAIGRSIDKLQLRKQLEQQLKPHQIPRIVNVVKEIDVTEAGKTRRSVEVCPPRNAR